MRNILSTYGRLYPCTAISSPGGREKGFPFSGVPARFVYARIDRPAGTIKFGPKLRWGFLKIKGYIGMCYPNTGESNGREHRMSVDTEITQFFFVETRASEDHIFVPSSYGIVNWRISRRPELPVHLAL